MQVNFMHLLGRALLAICVVLTGYRAAGTAGAVAGLVVAGVVFLLEWALRRAETGEFLWGAVGVLGGVALALLVGQALEPLMPEWRYLPELQAGLFLVLGYLGAVTMGLRHHRARWEKAGADRVRTNGAGVPKILDTSVIIDGRIADICKTNFLEGPLLVPRFVLRELQVVADSSDPLRRARGRRGLDILKRMQQADEDSIRIDDAEVADIFEVDSKLVRLAQMRGARIITNDLNLNKVAQVEGVEVLNVNDLANALRPVVLPGEEMGVRLLKRGKEPDQGIGYLEDGTMVVVEGASEMLGQTVQAEVTSVLQTAAGRMIFCKLK